MAVVCTRANGSSIPFATSAVLACILHTALTAIVVRLATTTTTTSDRSSASGLGLPASLFDVLVLANLVGEIVYFSRFNAPGDPASARARAILGCAAICLLATALVLSISVLAWMWTRDRPEYAPRAAEHSRRLDLAGFVIWALDLIAQILFYTLCLLPRRKLQDDSSRPDSVQDRPSPARSRKRSLSVHLTSLPPIHPPPFFRSVSAPISPSPSPYGSIYSPSPRSSFRHSMHHILRPVTSKTRLLLGHSYASRDSRSFQLARGTSSETARQDDGFQSWDTSAVEDQYEDALVPRNSKRKLETIPDSRPVSPARALDGPFPPPLSPEAMPLPESPLQSPVTSPASDTASIHGFALSTSRRPSANDQSHIHPLFRSHSPVPPPMVSPGTVVTASPYAGQVMSPELALAAPRRLHSAQGSRPASPSPLSPVRSRQSSFRSVHRSAIRNVEEAEPDEMPQLPPSALSGD